MHWFETRKRVVLIVDIVESVRLIQMYERESILHWLRIVEFTEEDLLSKSGGRLVKSLGDGMLLEFEGVDAALKVAFGIREFSNKLNTGLTEEKGLYLRLGMDLGDIFADRHDVYGHSVNMAARLASLARPGEIVVSAAVRDQLTPQLDADVEDMGDCFVKHVEQPIRAYRALPVGEDTVWKPGRTVPSILPTLAVVPFRTLQQDESLAIGHILAEELISILSRSPGLNVISRLSTAPFAGSEHSAGDIAGHLKANHVLSGRAVESGGKLVLSLDLTEARSNQVIWSDRYLVEPGNIMSGDDSIQNRIADEIAQAILKRELQRSRSMPVRTLESYTLLLGAIHSMYRLSRTEFQRSREMLEVVIDRNPLHSVPLAWMGNWHVLNVQQGWSTEREVQNLQAENNTSRALDLNPDCEYALTFDGFIKSNLRRDFDLAETRYDQALGTNPSFSMAWLLKGIVNAFRGDATEGLENSIKALSLSPLDPQSYFYDCLIGGCYAAAGDFENSYQHLRRSLKLNALHTSSLRVMTVTQWSRGKEEDARNNMQRMLALQPGLTVSKWKNTYGLAQTEYGLMAANIFEKAGMPAN